MEKDSVLSLLEFKEYCDKNQPEVFVFDMEKQNEDCQFLSIDYSLRFG